MGAGKYTEPLLEWSRIIWNHLLQVVICLSSYNQKPGPITEILRRCNGGHHINSLAGGDSMVETTTYLCNTLFSIV